MSIQEDSIDNVARDEDCLKECNGSPQGCDFFSWNRRTKVCVLAKVTSFNKKIA